MAIDTVKLLRLTGFGLRGPSGVPMPVTLAHNPALLGAKSYCLWLICFIVFGVAFALTGWRVRPAQPRWIQIASLVIQTSAAHVMLAERERLSRELHDTLGHHLTALSLNLEAARHLAADDRTREQVERAQSVTSLLLRDVRGVVSALRGEDPIGLADALRILVDAVPEPRIHLQVADDLPVTDPLRAQTVLRCVQEIITNAVRQAHAANLWIELSRSDSGLRITASDDGRGANEIRPGHGLLGMRERVEAVGGHLDIQSEVTRGF